MRKLLFPGKAAVETTLCLIYFHRDRFILTIIEAEHRSNSDVNLENWITELYNSVIN